MQPTLSPPEIFDRARRRALRERAGHRGDASFLWAYLAEDIAERLAVVSRIFTDILIIGPLAAHAGTLLGSRTGRLVIATLNETQAANAVVIEEDRLPFEEASFDLVMSAGTLDSVNDLPGALVQIRRVLRPDGLFLGHMFGAGTLTTLKSAMLAAEGSTTAPHIHPQIDLRTAADLMSRAGFALPVADQDVMTVHYSDWRRLVGDLRHAGIGNALAGPRHYLGRTISNRLTAEWERRRNADGRVEERFVHLNLSGWAPSPEQPQPARRGSGTVSLATALQPSSKPD